MRRKISITILQSVSHHLKTSFTQLHKCQRGEIAIIFAIILVPILAFIGVALDLSNLNSKRAEMQHVIDDAVLSVQKDISKTTTEKEVKNSLKAILAAKLPLKTGMYKIVTTQFNKRAGAVGIVVEGKVNVLFSHIYTLVGLDKRFASYLVTSGTVSDTTAYYVNYYFLLDNSSSMLFAATDHEAGRLKRATVIPCIDSGINKAPDCSVYPKKLRDTRIHNDMHNGCEFACHSRELLAADPPPPMQDSKVPQWRLMIQNLLRTQAAIPIRYRTFSGFKKYPTAFHAARAKNIKLRTNLTEESVSRILDLMLKNDPTGKYTRVAIYYFNLTTEKKFKLAPLTKARAARIKRTLTLKTISGDGLSSDNGLNNTTAQT